MDSSFTTKFHEDECYHQNHSKTRGFISFLKVPFFVLEHPHRLFFKNVRFYKPFWSVPFLLPWTDFHNSSYFQGYTQFLLRSRILWFYQYFRIVVFPMEKYTFCYVHGFNVLDQFSKSSYFQCYTEKMTRRRIHWVRLYSRIVVFPEENHTFWCVDGFVLWPVSQRGQSAQRDSLAK